MATGFFNTEMHTPPKLMAVDYCGPARLIPLEQIRIEDGWRFIGIDKRGGQHFCIVRRGDDKLFYMGSNTALFCELIGFLPDVAAYADEVQ
jgi:hypothetical protein